MRVTFFSALLATAMAIKLQPNDIDDFNALAEQDDQEFAEVLDYYSDDELYAEDDPPKKAEELELKVDLPAAKTDAKPADGGDAAKAPAAKTADTGADAAKTPAADADAAKKPAAEGGDKTDAKPADGGDTAAAPDADAPAMDPNNTTTNIMKVVEKESTEA